jgi:GNAT superfamily N-acetyltransferase
MTQVEFRIEQADSPAARLLIERLDKELRANYAAAHMHGIEAAGFEAAGGVFVVGYAEGEPVVCGAIRPYQGAAEIKRMFVTPEYRGRRLGHAMLRLLEQEAARRGFTRAILETGTKQTEAIALYTSAGWTRTPAFGEYVGSPVSVCFEKHLGQK